MAGPTADEIKNLSLDTKLEAVCAWAGMASEVQAEWARHLEVPEDIVGNLHPRVLATIPEALYQKSIDEWKVSFFSKSLAMQVYAAAKAVCDPPAPPSMSTALALPERGTGVKPPHSDGRKIKLSNFIDGADESEAVAATRSQMTEWYDNYKGIKMGDPLEDREPTPDQLAALHQRVVVLGMEPYADFSLLTPYGRRMAKALRHRS